MKIVELDSTTERGDSISPEVLERGGGEKSVSLERDHFSSSDVFCAHLISKPGLDDRRLSEYKSYVVDQLKTRRRERGE